MLTTIVSDERREMEIADNKDWRIKCVSCDGEYKTNDLPRGCKMCGKKVLMVWDIRSKKKKQTPTENKRIGRYRGFSDVAMMTKIK